MATNKQPRPELPANMIGTFAGALYRACPHCGAASRDEGLITEHRMNMPHGHDWFQRCFRCQRDFGYDRDIVKQVTA